jgi:hypothetical protein
MISTLKNMDGIHLKEIDCTKELHKQVFVEGQSNFFYKKMF